MTSEQLLRDLLVDRDAYADKLAAVDFPHIVDGKLNPEWLLAAALSQKASALAYLLAVIRQVAPEVADPVAEWLTGVLEDGEPLDELAVEMGQRLEAGEPFTLPGVSVGAS